MQRNDNTPETKAIKTALLLGVINLATSPLYCISGSASSLLALVVNALSIFQFHELGKSRRPGANFATKGWSLFASWVSPISPVETNEVDNTYRNIINGGAAIADETINTINKLYNNKPRR